MSSLLSKLSDKDKVRFVQLTRLKKAHLCADSLAQFTKAAWHIVEPGTPYVHGWHIDAICEHLEAVANGQIRNLIINVPPRHMKSTLVCVMFPAWVWVKLAWKRFLYASYAESLSIRDSIKCRDLIRSDWYRELFDIQWSLSSDQDAKSRFKNTSQGERIATSVDGAITGEGGDFMIADDPHNVKDANSDTKRQTALDWWDQSVSTRGNDPKTFSKIVIMQRVHEVDLSGHLVQQGGYEHLKLPAEFEKKVSTSIGWEDPRKEEGELLWPDRFGQPEIADLKKALGSVGSAAQLQQRPSPAEGNIFKRHWWKFYKERPTHFDFTCQSWDLPFKKTATSSYCVCTVWGRVGGNKYLLDRFRRRIGFGDQVKAFFEMHNKWPHVNAKFLEDAANAQSVNDTIARQIPGILLVKPDGDKITRASAVSPQIEAGNVWLPDPSICEVDPDTMEPWILGFIEECATFPNSQYKDQVDTMSMALKQMDDRFIPVWEPASITGPSKWLR